MVTSEIASTPIKVCMQKCGMCTFSKQCHPIECSIGQACTYVFKCGMGDFNSDFGASDRRHLLTHIRQTTFSNGKQKNPRSARMSRGICASTRHIDRGLCIRKATSTTDRLHHHLWLAWWSADIEHVLLVLASTCTQGSYNFGRGLPRSPLACTQWKKT